MYRKLMNECFSVVNWLRFRHFYDLEEIIISTPLKIRAIGYVFRGHPNTAI
jgi:hypothetical protein